MAKGSVKKIQTDDDVKRKAVKLVIAHLKKKASREFIGIDHVNEWLAEMEDVMKRPDFIMSEYIEMRKKLNDVIERTLDEEMRFKLRLMV